MALWRLFQGCNINSIDGDDRWQAILGYATVGSDAGAIAVVYVAYTASDLKAKFGTVSDTGNGSHYTLRDDATNSDVGLSITSTGWIEDLTSTAAIASGSELAFALQNLGMHGDHINMQAGGGMFTLENASVNAGIIGWSTSNTITTTVFAPFGPGFAYDAAEVSATHEMKRDTVLSNLSVTVSSESSSDFDHAPSKNGTASTSVTVNTAGTGQVEDTTGSETYAEGDDACFEHLRTAGSTNLTMVSIETDIEELWLGSQGLAGATNHHMKFSCTYAGGLDDEFDMRIGSVSAGNLVTYVVFAGGSPSSVDLRVGSTNSTNVSIDTTTSGYLEDVTGSESIGDADSAMIRYLGTGTPVEVDFAAVEIPWSATSDHKLATPPTATLTLTGLAPSPNLVVIPPTATLTLAGLAPSPAVAVIPPTAALTLTGQVPDSITPVVETPPVAALTLTGFAPDAITISDIEVVVPVAALTLTGLEPSPAVAVIPPTATLTLAGFAPSPNLVIVPPGATLTLTGQVPDSITPVVETPPTATLTLTGQAPSPAVAVIPPTATLTLTGLAPSPAVAVIPPTAALALAGLSPDISTPVVETPPTATLTLTGFDPSAGSSIIFQVAAASDDGSVRG